MVLVIGVTLLGTLLKDVFLVTNCILVSRLSQLATFDLRKLFYRRTLRMDLATFTDDGVSDLMSRFTNDMNQVAGGVETLFGKMIREPMKMIACLTIAAFICWRLLLLSMVVAPLAGWLIRLLAQTLRRANRRAMEGMAVIYNTLEETLGSIKIVKAFTNERLECRRFHLHSKNYLRRAMKIAACDSLVHPVTEIMGILAISLALMAGMWLMLSHDTHLLGIRIRDCAGPRLDSALFCDVAGDRRSAAEDLRRFQPIAGRRGRLRPHLRPVGTRAARGRSPALRPAGPAPSAARTGRRPLRLPARQTGPARHQSDALLGETIALVGPNGCGKSTLRDLSPVSPIRCIGATCIDGVPLVDVRLQELRGQIGLVTQETLLFDDTIFNNIRYGAPRATRDEVIAAAKQCAAHRFIETELPQGYDTPAERSAGGSPAGSGSGFRWPGPSSATPRS